MHPDLEDASPPEGRASPLARRLRALPECEAAPYEWAEFQRRARHRGRLRSGIWQVGWRHVAAAASLATVLIGVVLWGRLANERAPAAPPAASTLAVPLASDLGSPLDATVSARPIPPDASSASDARAAESIAQGGERLLEQAELSGRWLASLPVEPAVVRFSTRAAVTDLEDRIAWVDELLNAERLEGEPRHVQLLQQERARLVTSLAEVRYAEVLATRLP